MEHEITEHARKLYLASMNPRKKAWSKAKEIFFEILIIVFSVSLAVYLERLREEGHEQKAVKEFLSGLKVDLQNDINEMNSDKKSYIGTGQAFAYITSVKPGAILNKDTIRRYSNYLLNSTGLISNSGRYEGFKSSGKIINIENKELQNNILDLYQEDIPSLLASTNSYTKRKEILWQFMIDNMKLDKDGNGNMAEILNTDKGKIICRNLLYTGEILDRYDTVIIKSQRIISLIDTDFK